MACSNCNTPNCGCSGTYVVSQTCPPACSEVFNASCIVYTGVDLTCTDAVSGLTSTVVSRNDYMDTALTAIVNYICARFNPANLPSSVVVSGDDFVVVNASTVGYVTTYTVTLDPAGLPSASIVTEGENVTVTGDGSAGDPYVVNAENAIVISSSDILTVVPQVGVPSTYTTTYDIEVNEENLPDTVLNTSFGYISITETQNAPNAGDTTYTLEVDQVTIQSDDDRLAVTLLSAGGIAPFERTFNVAIDDAEMTTFIQDVAGATIVGGTDIIVTYDDIAGTITVTSTAGSPLAWFTMSDGLTDISAASDTDKLNIVGDAVTNGITTALTAVGPNEATFTINNEDRGSDQLIFGSVEVSGQPTITADSNTEVLTVVAGVDIEVTTDNVSKALTITNGIDAVYSNIEGDDSVSLQAGSTTDTLDILGGTGITTSGNAAGPGNNELIITNDALVYSTITGDTGSSPASGIAETLAIVSAGGGCSTTVTADTVTIENTSDIYSRVLGDSGSSSASGLTDTLTIAGGEGISTNSTGGTVTIAADVQKFNQAIATTTGVGAGGAITITHNFATEIVHVSLRDEAGLGYFVHGTDYSIAHVNGNSITITDVSGALSALVGATPLRALITG